MPVIPIIIAAAATAGSAATAAAGAVAAGAAAAGAGAAAAAGSVAAGVAAAGTTAAGVAGAITVTDVVVAGATTIAAKKVKDAYDEKKKEEGRAEGERETSAKYEIRMKKIVDALEASKTQMSNIEEYFKLIIALTAIGLATAKADGHISDDEMKDLDQFVAGMAHSGLPTHVMDSISQLKKYPPTFNTAMQYVNNLENADMELFESVIEVIAWSDGNFCKDERALLEAFRMAA